MPADGFTFTVLIRCQPYFLTFFCQLFQITNHFFLVVGNNIAGFEIVLDIYAHIVFLEVTDMAKATFHLEIRAQDLLYGFSLCRRLNYQQILRHKLLNKFKFDFQNSACDGASIIHLYKSGLWLPPGLACRIYSECVKKNM